MRRHGRIFLFTRFKKRKGGLLIPTPITATGTNPIITETTARTKNIRSVVSNLKILIKRSR